MTGHNMTDREVRVLEPRTGIAPLLAKGMANSVRRKGSGGELPARTAVVLDHRPDPERLAAYNRVCGFGLSDAVPATWLHVLSFPLQAYLMAEPDFPFPLAGVVHLSNQMTQHRLVRASEQVRFSVLARNLMPHRRGVAFEFYGEAHVGDELAWTGVSTYLAPKQTVPGEPVRLSRPDAPTTEPSQTWELPADLGRRYAKVSGDMNPIHMYPATARLFGFRRPIIHGMWTHARALAALGPRLPERYTVGVSFTKPIWLPGRVRFAAEPDAAGWRFAVLAPDGEISHMLGELAPV